MWRSIVLGGLLAISAAAWFHWTPDRYPPTSGLRWMGEAQQFFATLAFRVPM